MNLVRRNITANLVGQGWIALMGLVFVPFYLKFIGAEGYGLVGFFTVLSTSLSILDVGLSAAAVREVAKIRDASAAERVQVALLLRSIEVILWAIAFAVGFLVVLAAPLMAEYWLRVEPSKVESTINGLRLMGCALILQFPMTFYNGCLIGQQRQLAVNLIGSLSATIRGGGAVIVLWLVAPTLEAFFTWQCIVGALTVLSLRASLRQELRFLPGTCFFDISSVAGVKNFSLGVGGVNVLSFLLTQIDKIILSKILPIHMFGYYMLAWALGTLCSRLVGPVFNTYYPRLIELVNSGKSEELQLTYLKASQVMGALIAPVSIWLIFYSDPLLFLWTQDADLASSASVALKLIVAGTMLNALVTMPYALQLARGWTKLALWQNLLAVLFVIPATFLLAKLYSLSGAALPWFLLNLSYILISVPIMHRYFLFSAKKTWYLRGVILPIFASTTLVVGVDALLTISGIEEPTVAVIAVNLFASMGMVFYLLIWRGRSRQV
jgi:O-antigen/teichoic acid export membrane protein|nr:oligosaccharide flippase family protein [uncultured Pseudomonas sp.]